MPSVVTYDLTNEYDHQTQPQNGCAITCVAMSLGVPVQTLINKYGVTGFSFSQIATDYGYSFIENNSARDTLNKAQRNKIRRVSMLV